MTGGVQLEPPSGLFQLSLGYTFSRYDTSYEQFTRIERAAEQPLLDISLMMLEARYHIGDGFAVEGRLPFGLVELHRPDGGSSRVSGPGDLRLGVRYDFSALWGHGLDRPGLVLRAGLGLPTGETGKLGSAAEGLTPAMVAIGWRTFSADLSADMTWFVHRMVAVVAQANVRAPLARSPNGVRYGVEAAWGVGSVVIPVSGLSILGRFSANHAESVDEAPVGRVLNSGGTLFFAELAVGWQVIDEMRLGVHARVPVAAYAAGSQTMETFTLGANVSFSFDGDDDDDEEEDEEDSVDHDHGHTDPPPGGSFTRRSGPVLGFADAASGGESYKRADVLVEGRVTVIDYWADWCEPCHVLTGRLRELSKAHPETLAVRRVEVPDFESDVAKEHLAGVSLLPTIRIYGPDGLLYDQLVGAPVDAAVTAVQEALDELTPTATPSTTPEE